MNLRRMAAVVAVTVVAAAAMVALDASPAAAAASFGCTHMGTSAYYDKGSTSGSTATLAVYSNSSCTTEQMYVTVTAQPDFTYQVNSWFLTCNVSNVYIYMHPAYAYGPTDCGDITTPPVAYPSSPYNFWLDVNGTNTTALDLPLPVGRMMLAGVGAVCLDDNGGKTTDGNKVDIWTCNSTSAQVWTFERDKSVRALGKCLDVYGAKTTAQAIVDLWTCNGHDSQQWTYNASTERLTNPVSGMCLDDNHATSVNGTQQEIYPCNTTDAQIWEFLPS